MSAIDASARERLGFGQRLARLAASLPFDRTSTPVLSTDRAAAPARSETLLRRHLRTLGTGSVAVEICQAGNGCAAFVPDGVEHRALPLSGAERDVLAALQSCAAGSLAAVYSIDTIEHLRMPWLVAGEIARVLKPGGITFHTSVFTTRYQPMPEDFFRFTPEGMKALFAGFECLTAEFDATERHCSAPRRSGTGDIFGGSREGWRVTYAGRKALRR